MLIYAMYEYYVQKDLVIGVVLKQQKSKIEFHRTKFNDFE